MRRITGRGFGGRGRTGRWGLAAASAAVGAAGLLAWAAGPAGAAKKPGVATDADPGSGKFDVEPDGALLGGHRGAVRALAYSPDGTVLASGADDGTVVLWDADTKSLLKTFTAGPLSVRAVAFSRDGKSVAVAHGPELSLWTVETGEKLWAVNPTDGGVLSAIAISQKGDVAWVGDLTGSIAGAKLKDGKKVSRWKAYEMEVRAVATSAKSPYLAATGDLNGGHYFSLPKGKRVKDVSFADNSIVAFAPAGGHVALGGDLDVEPSPGVRASVPGVLVLDVPDGDEITRISLDGSRGHVAALAWHKSGKMLAVAITGDGPSFAIELNPKKYFFGEIGTNRTTVAFSPDGTRLAAGSSGSGMIGAYRVTSRL